MSKVEIGIMVEVRGLVKSYHRKTAVNNVSFSVKQAEIFGLLGPNGAGKTTTLEMIEGIRIPDAGTALLAGATALWAANSTFYRP